MIKSSIKKGDTYETSYEFYKDMYENSPDMVVVGDHSNLLITDCNQTFLDRMGYTYDEIINISSYLVVYHPDCYEKLDEFVEEYARVGFAHNVELALKTKTGEKIPVSLSVSGQRNDRGEVTHTRAVFRDMTDLIAARQEIASQMEKYREKSEELEKRNQDLDTFVHLVAHDLRAPLRAISSYAFFLREDSGNVLSTESQGYLDSLDKKITSMSKLMNDIIYYFLLNSEVRALETINLNDFIIGIQNVLPIPPGFEFKIQADLTSLTIHKLPLQQVLHNLFSNAIKHHDCPSTGQILIKVEETSSHYILDVEDNGPGISFEYRDYIFEAFKTLHSKDDNSGLGLAIVKRIVNQEGGQISLLETEEGRGTTFRVEWPKRQS